MRDMPVRQEGMEARMLRLTGTDEEHIYEMSKYCSEVYVLDSIDCDSNKADGLFCAWIGKVR